MALSIEKMKLVSLTGKFETLNDVADACLDSGCFQPENTADYFAGLKGVTRIAEENPFEQPIQRLFTLISALGEDFGPLDFDDSSPSPKGDEERIREIIQHFNARQTQDGQVKPDTLSPDVAQQIQRFGGLNVKEGDVFSSQYLKITFGQISADSYQLLKAVGNATKVVFTPLSKENDYYWGMFLLPREEDEDVSFTKLNEDNPYQRSIELLKSLVGKTGQTDIFDLVTPEKSFPVGRPEDYAHQIEEIEQRLGTMQKERSDLLAQIEADQASIDQLGHFTGLDIELGEVLQSKYIKVRFGRLPIESYKLLDTYADNPYILFAPFSSDKNYYWGMYLAPLDHINDVDRIFAGLFFERLHIPDVNGSATEAIQEIAERVTAAKARLEEIDKTERDYWSREREHCLRVYSQLIRQSDIYEIRKYAVKHTKHFILLGWIPQKEEKRFCALFQKMPGVELTLESTDEVKQIDPPVKLKNHRLFRPFEYYVKMYGMPKYGEVDPTAFVAITYTILYGIMFADLGQGIVLAIAGWLMYRLKGMELGKVLIPCGISGAVFGLLFGSVFGFEHALDGLYRSVFGLEGKPIEVMSSENTTMILLVAIAIGVCLMILALVLNIYSRFKQHQIGSALFTANGVTGLILYTGILLLLLSLLIELPIPTPVITIGFIGVPVVVLWLQEPLVKLVNGEEDWKPESWGGYLVQGFFEVFESLLSYVTNTVSFLRVGAFVLVHASMMMVFFSLAEMMGPASFVMIIFGNVFVLVLEGLLVGVQSLRLEFYEMFSRFFEGSGRSFEPLLYGSAKQQ